MGDLNMSFKKHKELVGEAASLFNNNEWSEFAETHIKGDQLDHIITTSRIEEKDIVL